MQRGKIFRKGSSWHLRYKTYSIVGGKKVWQTTSTKLADYDLRHRTQESVAEDANKFLREVNQSRGTSLDPTFGEQALVWLERCKTRQRKPIKQATINNWRSHLNVHILPVLKNTSLPDLTNKVVKDFVTSLVGRLSPKSVTNIVQVIKMVKASAINEHGDELYPTKWNHGFIDLPEINSRDQHTPSFASGQIEALIKAGDRRIQMLTILAAGTGLRQGELFGLEVRHFDGGSIKVEQEAWQGLIQEPKTKNAHRIVELDPRVAKLLKSFIGNRTKGYIFQNGGSNPIHPSNFLRREFHPLLKTAGIPRCGLHGFRRYRNTYLRNVVGCPPGLLIYWLGHSGKDMSDLYDKVKDDPRLRKAQAKKMGVGFKLPARLKTQETKQRKFVVSLVVRHPQSETRKLQIAL